MRISTVSLAAATILVLFLGGTSPAQEEAPWRTPPYLLTNIPKAQKAPELDGRIDPEEWKDALEWGVFFHGDLKVLVPPEVATRLWMKWDEENLYVAISGVLYPEDATVRGTERVRQATPGIQNADHVTFDLFPLGDRSVQTISRAGSFSWTWNPLGTLSDFHLNVQPGNRGDSWVSEVEVASHTEPGLWQTEMKIPLEQLKNENMAGVLKLPPRQGNTFLFHAARRFGADADSLNVATGTELPLFIQRSQSWASAWETLPAGRLTETAPVLHLESLGNLAAGEFQPTWAIFNPAATPVNVEFEVAIFDPEGKKLYDAKESISAVPGELTPGPALSKQITLPPQGLTDKDVVGAKIFLRIQDESGTHLFIGPGLPFFVFDEQLNQQFRRGLEVLRSSSSN